MTQIIGKGTRMQLSISTVYTDIAQVLDINPPQPKVEHFKSTDLSSGAGHTYLPTGYVEGGECSFEIYYDMAAATHTALTALITTPAVSSWKVIFANSGTTTWSFSGILESFDVKVVMDNAVKATVKIKVTSTISFS